MPHAPTGWFRTIVLEGLVVGVLVGLLTAGASVWTAAMLDDRRSQRELAASERLGWRVTLAQDDSFPGIDLSDTDLSSFQLVSRDFSRANFSDADMSAVNLARSDLVQAELSGANLTDGTLAGASLAGATVRGTTLRSADLNGADLSSVDLRATVGLDSAILSTACFDSQTLWPSDPPKLDWKACWAGFDDIEGPSATARLESNSPPECVYRSELLHFYFDYVRESEDAVCGYLNYLRVKSIPGDADSQAFSGDDLCERLNDGIPDGFLVTSIDGLTPQQTNTVALAAAEYLCPEQRDVLYAFLSELAFQ